MKKILFVLLVISSFIFSQVEVGIRSIDKVSKNIDIKDVDAFGNIPEYYQVNISAIFKSFLIENTNFKIGINNLFDYTNFDDTTFQNPGLTYLMEISYKYDFK